MAAGFEGGGAVRGGDGDPHGDLADPEEARAVLDRDLPHVEAVLDGRQDAIAASDAMALGAMRALRDAGLEVPGDVAVAGFDGFAASESSSPPLTTVRQPVGETAQRAVDLLNRLIRGDVEPPVADIVPVELVVRGSTLPHAAGREP